MTKHLRIFALIFCLLFAVSPAWAANNWAGSNACAVWSLDDSGGLVLTDGVGNNDLTDYNTVGQDTVDYKEGNGCADFEFDNTEALYCLDANLDAGFPGKNGGSEIDFSICKWVKLETNQTQGFIAKFVVETDKRVFAVGQNATDHPFFAIGHTAGTAVTVIALNTVMTTGVWYHLAATYTASDNSMKLRVWDDNAGALLDANATGTSGGDMSPRDSALTVGSYSGVTNNNFDGQLDEVVIFAGEAIGLGVNEDAHKIQLGTYGVAGVTMPIFDHYYRQH